MSSLSISAACCVTRSDGAVLLIQRADNGQWQIPGGVVELGESPKKAAIRETQEETGLVIVAPVLRGVYTNTTRGIVAHVFHTSRYWGELNSDSPETKAVAWVPFPEACERVPEVFRYRIIDAFAEPTAPVVFRQHDDTHWIA